MPLYLTFALTLLLAVTWTAARMVFSLYALTLGAQPFAVGILAAMFNLFPLLLSWPIGTLSDRVGPRLPLMLSTVCGVIGLVIPYFAHDLAALYVAAALVGLSFALYLVNVQNLVGLLSAPEKRAQNFSTFSLLGSASNFIGPLMAGFSIDHSGHAVACLYIVTLSIVAGAMLLIWGDELPGGTRKGDVPASAMLETLANRGLWPMLITSSLVKLGTDLFQFYLPIYGHQIGISASAVGAVLATLAASQFIVRFALPRLIGRLGEERLLANAFYCAAVGFMLVAFTRNAVLLAMASFVFGIGMGCGQPIATILMFSRSAEGRSGETLGLRLTVNNLMRVVGPALFGFIASALGLFPVFCINALMMGLGGLLSRPKHDK
jgi:MFS family permease